MTINKTQSEPEQEKVLLSQEFTRGILKTLKDGDSIKIEGPEGHFDIYKSGEAFGVRSNSLGAEFMNNPMSAKDMEKTISTLISGGDNFKEKIPHEVVLGIRDIFFEKNKDNEKRWDDFDIDVLFQSVTLEDVIKKSYAYKNILRTMESLQHDGIVEYLEGAVNYIHEQVVNYPDGSVIKKILSNKMKYLEEYRKNFSDGGMIDAIKKHISDIESFLGVLGDDTIEANPFKQEISRIEKTVGGQDTSQEEAKNYFNKIYAWDAFAIPYAQFSDPAFSHSVDGGTLALALFHGRDTGSKKIVALGGLQEHLVDDKDFRQKIDTFTSAHEAYTEGLVFLLGTGHNAKISSLEHYEKMKNQLSIEKFIALPCSDIYPVAIQKALIPLYVKDLQTKVCEVMKQKTLDKSIKEYIAETKNPSGILNKIQNFSGKELKITTLETVQNELKALKVKYDKLNRLSDEFKDAPAAELEKIAIEFCITTDFFETENTRTDSPVYIPDQEKLISFMEKNR